MSHHVSEKTVWTLKRVALEAKNKKNWVMLLEVKKKHLGSYFGAFFGPSILPSPSLWIACNVRIFRLFFSKHRTGSMNFIQFLHSSTTAFITMCLGCMESQLCFSIRIWDSILLSGSSTTLRLYSKKWDGMDPVGADLDVLFMEI